jgi:type III restriction enzyme
MPQAVHDFVEANNFNKKHIHVLVINSGMINSKSLVDIYDTGLLGLNVAPKRIIN